MEGFSRFEFKMPSQQNIPKKEKEEPTTQSKLDISLEEIALNEKKKESDSNKVTADDFKPTKKVNNKRKRYVHLMVPHQELMDLCNDMKINTKGYHVSLEAVITN